MRSPDSVNSSPLQSPRRRNQEENRWLEELDNFELLREEQNQNFQRSRSNQLEMNGKKTWQNPSSARANFVSFEPRRNKISKKVKLSLKN